MKSETVSPLIMGHKLKHDSYFTYQQNAERDSEILMAIKAAGASGLMMCGINRAIGKSSSNTKTHQRVDKLVNRGALNAVEGRGKNGKRCVLYVLKNGYGVLA